MTYFFLKNRFTNCALKNRFNITIKMVHAACSNIKALLRINRLLYVEHLRNLELLYLDHNNIIGHIPTQLSNIHGLQELDLSHNFLSGEIPIELTAAQNGKLLILDISFNNLTGRIPHFLTYIPIVNLSYNSLKGPISFQYHHNHASDTLIGNKNLCGGNFKGFPPCPHKPKLEIFVPVAIFFGLLVLGGFLLSRHKVKKTQSNSGETKNGNLFSIWNYDGHIAYEDIIEATEDFDIKYCIEIGGYGSVYKAELPCGKVIALKKLHRLEAENLTFDVSFNNEVKVLTKIQHRNIIKLHGFCLHKRCMFLVYEYMERGSLFCVLSNDVETIELDWSKRVNIIKCTAHALSYMHHECISTIVHQDITSNNILLNSKL
jgi:hypothetical protein